MLPLGCMPCAAGLVNLQPRPCMPFQPRNSSSAGSRLTSRQWRCCYHVRLRDFLSGAACSSCCALCAWLGLAVSRHRPGQRIGLKGLALLPAAGVLHPLQGDNRLAPLPGRPAAGSNLG